MITGVAMCVCGRGIWEISVPSFQVSCESKNALKIRSIKSLNKTKQVVHQIWHAGHHLISLGLYYSTLSLVLHRIAKFCL